MAWSTTAPLNPVIGGGAGDNRAVGVACSTHISAVPGRQ
jgi:hypothetical protein